MTCKDCIHYAVCKFMDGEICNHFIDKSQTTELSIKVTDNEIVKALECCTTKGAKCSDCPAFKKVDRSDCKKYFRGAIDLINRQQAENEILNNNISAMVVTLRNSAKATRNEAIKEFAYRLKKEFLTLEYQVNTTRKTLPIDYVKDQIKWLLQEVSIDIIDSLVEEYEKGR